jgi:leucyl-tRNA synthetase
LKYGFTKAFFSGTMVFMEDYNPKNIGEKWCRRWEKDKRYEADEKSKKPKNYVLDMFPYPSGQGLHMGHVEGYTATDIYCRFQRMNGFNVLHPMGWDAFGLPAENYAIKTGVHPRETTSTAIKNFTRQIKAMGLSYDWTREIGTQNPDYYKWTQWLFVLFFKNGLAYKKKAKVNWDPVDQTVLANEQVLPNGTAERSGAKVVQKDLEQWFFKITDFAEDLINDLDTVDWPAHTVTNQRNWIGKSEGAEITFHLQAKSSQLKASVQVFTTRPDTLFGATYVVLSPEHALVEELKDSIQNWDEVEKYRTHAAQRTDLERTTEQKDSPSHDASAEQGKTGVELKGVKATNPANKEEIPIFIADYVLAHYGAGAIMAVPAHDERDWEFAKQFNLPTPQVICQNYPEPHCPILEEAYSGEGHLVGSGEFDGMPSEEARKKITEFVGGTLKTTYRLRDWLVSRQRYWGAPIPVVYDPDGKAHAVPEEHLPWTLPQDVEFTPHGSAPLSQSKELKERTEKLFGKGWTPEVDTMDTFVDSSWYFFRFTDSKNEKEFASKKQLEKWMPVDLYMGGAEHTVLHLMYARFFTKVLHKLGYISFNEPFSMLRHQGIVLGEDNYKMSKSRGNIVNPDEVVDAYGADTVRLYSMFMGPLEDAKPWNSQSIAGAHRFVKRVWGLAQGLEKKSKTNTSAEVDPSRQRRGGV